MSVARSGRGQATPLVAVVLLLAALALVPTGMLVRAARDRAQARTAADAAALAGAAAGRAEAEAVATDNGARVVAYVATDDTVEVTVTVGGRQATARAIRVVVIVPPERPPGAITGTPDARAPSAPGPG